MKKSILLGAAALAAVTFAGASADAGEVKIGGYYMFRMSHNDINIVSENDDSPGANKGTLAGAADEQFWSHRLQLNLDMKATDKSHAHMRVRIVDGAPVEGGDMGTRTGMLSTDNRQANPGGNPNWAIRQLWLETEAWGVGVKVGEMPLAMNDNLLVNNDTTSFGTIMLSKTFGNTTVVGANVKLREDSIGRYSANAPVAGRDNGQSQSADKDDIDLYALSVLGKMGSAVSYQATLAYLRAQSDSLVSRGVTRNYNDEATDLWLALTLNMAMGKDTSITGTLIYENGMNDTVTTAMNRSAGPGNNSTGERGIGGNFGMNQLADGGYLAAIRAKGKAGFGGWNAYGFYASENFTNISNYSVEWSPTWDQGGPNGRDLMNTAFTSNNGWSSPSENLWGVGAGLTINAGKFTIKPMLDYGQVVETNLNYHDVPGAAEVPVKSAWGGSLILSTNIQTDTVLTLTGQFVQPKLTDAGRAQYCITPNRQGGNGNGGEDCGSGMHQLMADIKMSF